MEHGLELIIARLEILEIEVCNIIHNPGNIGNHSFSIFRTPGNIGNLFFPFSGYPGNIGNIFFLVFGIFQKRRAPKFHVEWSNFQAEISHLRPIQSRKLKLFQNFGVTATAAAASQQLSHLARALDHHAQGPTIPFGVNPSLRP